jgi:hypothetical protein
MAETKSAPKSLYDLAKALDRWDDEGGAAGSSRADLGRALALHAAEERVLAPDVWPLSQPNVNSSDAFPFLHWSLLRSDLTSGTLARFHDCGMCY